LTTKTKNKPLLSIEEWEPLATVGELPGFGETFIGKDGRSYRRTQGLLQIVCPITPDQRMKPELVYCGYDESKLPPWGELKYLFKNFLSKYDREVMYIIGEKRDKSGYVYVVPDQEGTPGSIDWKDPIAMDKMVKVARWIGTVHVHPGNSASPSSVDLESWEEREQSGLHLIFGRNGDWTLHGSSYGHVVRLDEGKMPKTSSVRVPLETYGRELASLLREPKPVHIDFYGHGKGRTNRGGKKYKITDRRGSGAIIDINEPHWWEKNWGNESDMDFFERMLRDTPSACVSNEELSAMVCVQYNGLNYIMSHEDWAREVKIFNNSGVLIPESLTVRPFALSKKGG